MRAHKLFCPSCRRVCLSVLGLPACFETFDFQLSQNITAILLYNVYVTALFCAVVVLCCAVLCCVVFFFLLSVTIHTLNDRFGRCRVCWEDPNLNCWRKLLRRGTEFYWGG